MDVNCYKDGQECCKLFYLANCCEIEVLPDNPHEEFTEQWKSWNSGWNIVFPECSRICKSQNLQIDLFNPSSNEAIK